MNGRQAATEPIPLTLAARSAGIPARTLRNWIASGKLAAIRGQRGWLVRPGDIAQIAAMLDNQAASENMADGMAARLAAELAAPTAEDAGGAAITATAQHAQAEALVQQLLAPFIAEQTRLAEELGQVKAERDAKDATIAELRQRAETAEAELARRHEEEARAAELLRRRNEQEWLNRERMQAAEDGPGAAEAPTAAQGDAPGVWGRLTRWWGRAGER